MSAEPEDIAAMEGKTCPFCGDGAVFTVAWINHDNTTDYNCGTEGVPGGFIRSNECYERQLAQQAEVMREVLEAIRKSIINLPDHKDKWPCHCITCAVGAYLKAVVPKLEAMVEKKP